MINILKTKVNSFYDGLDNNNKNIFQLGAFFSLLSLLVIIVWVIISHLEPKCGASYNKLTSLQLYKEKKNGAIFDIVENHSILNKLPHNDYTFSFWIKIDKWYNSSEYGKWKHILHMGSIVDDENNLLDIKWNSLSNQNPGVWLMPETNKLRIVITNQNNQLEYSDLKLDIKKWVNITFIIKNRYLEIYKNGELVKTSTLKSIPAINRDILYVNYNGGFTGYLRNIEIIPKGIEPRTVERLYELGNSQ